MHGLRLENALGRDELGSLSVVESQIWPFCSDQKRAAGCQRGHRYTSAFMLSRSAVVFWMSRPRLTCSVGDIGKQRYRREVVEFWCSVSPAPAPARCVARGAMTKLRAFDTKFTLATVHCARPTNTSHAATLPSRTLTPTEYHSRPSTCLSASPVYRSTQSMRTTSRTLRSSSR